LATQTSASSGSIGFGGALALLFIALKLAGVIDWSWWWVTSPIWIPLAVFAVFMVILGVLALVFRDRRGGRR
jgi:ABC-type polysaccharide/polyol phosphate export permease